MIKSRNPFLALLLSIIPGLGQIYNGQLRKACVFLAIDLIGPIIFGLTGVLNNLEGLVILVVFSLSFMIYRMADGLVQAKKLANYELKTYNKGYVYLSFVIAFSVVRTFLDIPASTGIRTFITRTPAMNPTLQPEDCIVANLDYYNSNTIQQGDIVVFNAPQGGIWIFRIIGLPNDSIEIKDGYVYVNNLLNETIATNEYILGDQVVIEHLERINSAKTISTLRHKQPLMQETQAFEKTRIPENEYFLMGDNRDNAFDSRFIGAIKKDDILGRVMYSYWGSTRDRINIVFAKE